MQAMLCRPPARDYGALFRHPPLCGEEDQMMRQPVTAVSASLAGDPDPACAAAQDPCPSRSAPLDEDDGTLAAMYLRMWSLATGRRLPPGVRLEDLTEDELVGFWADDLSPVSGRHAARNADPVRGAR
jgi:hypothetical protein